MTWLLLCSAVLWRTSRHIGKTWPVYFYSLSFSPHSFGESKREWVAIMWFLFCFFLRLPRKLPFSTFRTKLFHSFHTIKFLQFLTAWKKRKEFDGGSVKVEAESVQEWLGVGYQTCEGGQAGRNATFSLRDPYVPPPPIASLPPPHQPYSQFTF